ncbi:MAG: hypothetical protein US50_C0021G0002 [Candidatus Nomurabacteria bacterium GW2011_GWB1_37_5]|uniref:Phosphodiester glycosidase domain-containing protein n=1 Tax=Candidatus Nomurabacteria bacterium GW2011_GWB1_37_5 TaxID=1618742 RepID=A0A0G0GW45_9BACT|nr:MAG: hypothetical protein US50_C0021G0002 [Candidatus Nomurabacteria bacterium GW2011_GWB1_37_5]
MIFYKDESGKRFKSLEGLKKDVENGGHTLVFATNGGIYNSKHEPNGLYVENGIEKYPLNLEDGQGNLYLKPNGVFLIRSDGTAAIINSTKYDKYGGSVLYAVQSGPLLLSAGQTNPQFNENSENKYIRSGVGVISDSLVVIAISDQTVNFYEFAKMFQDLGCKNALYLDGAISKMYLPDTGRNDELDGDFATIIAIIK